MNFFKNDFKLKIIHNTRTLRLKRRKMSTEDFQKELSDLNIEEATIIRFIEYLHDKKKFFQSFLQHQELINIQITENVDKLDKINKLQFKLVDMMTKIEMDFNLGKLGEAGAAVPQLSSAAVPQLSSAAVPKLSATTGEESKIKQAKRPCPSCMKVFANAGCMSQHLKVCNRKKDNHLGL